MSLLAILQQLADYDTALLANTIGYIDPTPDHEWYMGGSIVSNTPALGPTVGVAMTCEIDSSTPLGKAEIDPYYEELLPAIERAKEPVILVLKAVGSRPDHECVLGDGNAKILQSVGCIGAVTDGRVRDVEGMMTTNFACYSRGRTIHHCALRWRRINQPVEVGGITVNPGDVIHANMGGVIKIPRGALEALPERAAAMRAFEHEVHCIWRQPGISIAAKRRDVGAILKKYKFPA